MTLFVDPNSGNLCVDPISGDLCLCVADKDCVCSFQPVFHLFIDFPGADVDYIFDGVGGNTCTDRDRISTGLGTAVDVEWRITKLEELTFSGNQLPDTVLELPSGLKAVVIYYHVSTQIFTTTTRMVWYKLLEDPAPIAEVDCTVRYEWPAFLTTFAGYAITSNNPNAGNIFGGIGEAAIPILDLIGVPMAFQDGADMDFADGQPMEF